MSKVHMDDALLDHLSHLARLRFSGEERDLIRQDLERILDFIDKLENVDTEGVEPLTYLSDRSYVLQSPEDQVLRQDRVEQPPSISHEEALKNAPGKDSDYFRVPKVLDKSS